METTPLLIDAPYQYLVLLTMKTFSVTESTISAHGLAVLLKEVYHLPGQVTCRLFRTGINHLYFVNAGEEKSVFRIYTFQWRSKKEIEEEIRLLRFLYLNDVSVSIPLPDTKLNFIQEINAPEGLRYGVMFSFAKGKKDPRFSEVTAHHIGITMAKLHQLTANYPFERIDYNIVTLLEEPFNSCESFFGNVEEIQFLFRLNQYLKSKLQAIDASRFRKGVIHLDIWFDNLHVSGEDNITLFDFDFCGNGYLCFDVAYFLYQLYYTNPDENQYHLKAQAFSKGYESITALSAEEKEILPVAALSIIQFYLGVQCDRFDTWSNVFLNEDYLKRFTGIMKKWMDKNKIAL